MTIHRAYESRAAAAKPSKTTPTSSEVIHNAIKKHAGLSEFDDEAVAEEVAAIRRALRKKGFSIIWEG